MQTEGAAARRDSAAGEPDPNLEDVRLMRVVAEGGPGARAAFRRLFERHYAGVVRFCQRIVGDPALAEELAQETFLRLYRASERYEPRAKFRTFLLTIAQRLCLNELRRPRHRAGASLSLDAPLRAAGEGDGPAFELADDDAIDPERRAVGRQRLAKVAAVLEEMPPRQRVATILNRFEGLAYEEVAESLGCSTRAVKSLLNRSRNLIADRMRQGRAERRSPPVPGGQGDGP